MIYAFDLASANQADAVLCVAADAITDTVKEAYAELGVLATSEPGSNGAGFALAEGAVALMAERLSKAQERGARIYGEVLGYGITSDAQGVGMMDAGGAGILRGRHGERWPFQGDDRPGRGRNPVGGNLIDDRGA